MRLLERTFDGIELALLGAERASDALVRIDIGFLTALEIRLHRAGRTSVRTSHAAHTLLVVDLRHAIFHLNRAKVASLYASFTADAGTVALFLQSNALLRIVAINLNLASSRAHGQNMLRAGSDALLTRLALFLIDNRDLLDRIDVNRIKRARTLTGSQTQAGIGTRLRSAVDHRRSNAIGHTLVDALGLAMVAVALAGNRRNHANGLIHRHAHDFRHLRGARGTADGAGADLSLALADRSGIAVAARKTAGATIRARQTSTQSFDFFIGGHFENAAGDAQQRTKDQAQNAHHKRGNQNCTNTHVGFLPRFAIRSDR